MDKIFSLHDELLDSVSKWEPILHSLPEQIISLRVNKQGRSVRQIIGHMIDSASNNLHRVVHLQYGPDPLRFPDYAGNGNNERWIRIQNYQNENFEVLMGLWKYSHYHFVHVVKNLNPDHLKHKWETGPKNISLEEMLMDFPRHFNLHLDEIRNLVFSE